MLSYHDLDDQTIVSQISWLFDPVAYIYRLILKKNPNIFFGDKLTR